MIKGIGASDGIVISKVYKYEQVEPVVELRNITDVKGEIAHFEDCVEKSIAEIEGIKEKATQSMDEETGAIFGAHIEILKDPEIIEGVKSAIENDEVAADFALKTVTDTFIAIFEAMDNEYIRERAADIKDVTKRLLCHLQGLTVANLSEISEEVIVVAKDLTPSDTATLNRKFVKGFITDIGGRTSHSAIMARTLEIPAVVGTNDFFEKVESGDIVILNGLAGEVIINPSEEELSTYDEKIKEYNEQKKIWDTFRDKESLTKDGVHIELVGNIGNPEDAKGVVSNGGDGVGLYRTEFLYMGKSDFPTEDEQYEAYKEVLTSMGDKPVVVRTLDIGGDKHLDYLPMDEELNPFLGVRALRLCLAKKDLFEVQLRALLRASVHGNLHIMFPMVATLNEFRAAKKFLKEVEEKLKEEHKELEPNYKLGIMVEIPATALLADVFAKEVDFFSIGTNDLVQYTFAADRMNENVSYLYQPYNPSLLRLIKMVGDSANKNGKWAGMCGEMAGEVTALPLLVGLGLKELSMSAMSILRSRHLLSKLNKKDCENLVNEAINMDSNEAVKELVDKFLKSL